MHFSAARRPCVFTPSRGDPVRELLTHLESKLRGSSTTSHGFNPHVTLFYDIQVVEQRAIEPIALQVREIAMVHNRLGTGLPYEIPGRWPLHLAHALGRDPRRWCSACN